MPAAATSTGRVRRVPALLALLLAVLLASVIAGVVLASREADEAPLASAAPRTRDVQQPPPWQSLVATSRADAIMLHGGPDPARRSGVLRARWLERGALTFLVVEREPGWLRVALPRRPNGSTAWVRSEDVHLTKHDVAIRVSLRARRLVVLERGRAIATSRIVVGAAATPTPRGRFYVTNRVRLSDPAGPYGPYALGLSAHSEALATFNGQPAQIALHGTNQPRLLGQAASNGCIRMPNRIASLLMRRVPAGTPVTIV